MLQPTEKFGDVFLTKLDENGRDINTPTKLVGVRFSNWDCHWYEDETKERKIHPEFIKHVGQKTYLEMKLKTRNPKTGEDGCYRGRLLLSFQLGELPVPDLDSIAEEDLGLMELLKQLRIIKNPDDPKATQFSESFPAALICFMTPGQKQLQDYRGLARFFHLIVFFDDFLEDHKFYSYSELTVVKHAIHEIMDGRNVDWSREKLKIREFEPEMENNVFCKILDFVRYQTQLINEKAVEMNVSPKYLIEKHLEYFDSMMLDNCSEWVKLHDQQSPIYRRLQQELRRVTISTQVWIEFIMLENGIHLNDEIRNTFLVRKFFEVIAEQTGLVNDIFSYYKETCNGEIGSTLYLLHVRDGLSVEESLERVIDMANRHTYDACKIGNLLIKMYEGNDQVRSLVKTGKSVMQGHMMWYTYSKRYQPDLVFHCLVNDDDNVDII